LVTATSASPVLDWGDSRSVFTAPWWGTVIFAGALVLGLAAPVVGLLDGRFLPGIGRLTHVSEGRAERVPHP
jgi:hypothetical protein